MISPRPAFAVQRNREPSGEVIPAPASLGCVGESGRPRLPVTQEITGSNPVVSAIVLLDDTLVRPDGVPVTRGSGTAQTSDATKIPLIGSGSV